MANERLFNDPVPQLRFWIAFPEAFADWQNPTIAEFNSNPTNDPTGLIFNITCALNQDGTQFDLGDSDTDDSLTFCQVAGAVNPTTLNPEIVLEIERSKDPLQANTANLAFSLLAWKGAEFFAIASVGEDPDEPVALGDRIKMARVAVDYPTDVFNIGENVRLQQTVANRGDVNWNYEIAA